jgi:hypothetical protein
VFMDIDGIPAGADFRGFLEAWIRSCDVLLAVVGPRWREELDARASAPDGGGQDFVAMEIAESLAQGIPVIPVLVGRASMPAPGSLPSRLQRFAFLNAAEVASGADFHPHVDRLVRAIDETTERPRHGGPEEGARASTPEYVIVVPPAVARPVNLAFERGAGDGMPEGWCDGTAFVIGTSANYGVRVEPRHGDADAWAEISRAGAGPGEFGSLMQRVPAHALAGKRIRFQAELSTRGLSQWAGLWLRLDGRDGVLFFDNMHDRPVTGDTPWTRYTVEADAPDGIAWLNYGVLLAGDGAVRIRRAAVLSHSADRGWDAV